MVARREREGRDVRDMNSGYPVDTVQAGQLVGRIVGDRDRYFDWYGESVTELAVRDCEGREVRLAVADHNRRVIRAGFCGQQYGSVSLYSVPGLVRRFYGPATYGHSEWFIGEMVTDYGDWSDATPIGQLV